MAGSAKVMKECMLTGFGGYHKLKVVEAPRPTIVEEGMVSNYGIHWVRFKGMGAFS